MISFLLEHNQGITNRRILEDSEKISMTLVLSEPAMSATRAFIKSPVA
jgi:hypothetical protein